MDTSKIKTAKQLKEVMDRMDPLGKEGVLLLQAMSNDGKEDSHRSLDDGTIDFEDFFRALAELRLKPEICIEQTPEPLARSIDWLRERDLID